jgi:hypothetical protein
MWKIATDKHEELCSDFLAAMLGVRDDRHFSAWRDYVGWYIALKLVGVYEDGGIDGVIMGRPIAEVSQGNHPYAIDWSGKTLWVEQVALDGLSFRGAMDFALQELGGRGFEFDTIAWHRSPHSVEPRVISIGNKNKITNGVEYAGV